MDLLKDGITETVKEFISIAFESAEINDLIVNEPSFKHLEFFDPGAIFTADMDSLQVAKVMSMISNLQDQMKTLSTKVTSTKQPPLNGQIVERIENVGFQPIYFILYIY